MQKDITQALFYSTLHAFVAFFAFVRNIICFYDNFIAKICFSCACLGA